MIGALVVFCVGSLFRTPQHVLDEARAIAAEASEGDDRPIDLRAEEIEGEASMQEQPAS